MKRKRKPIATSLISESPLTFVPSVANAVGLNEAIFLQQLHYWLYPGPRTFQSHQREWDGEMRPWIFNTYDKRKNPDSNSGSWVENFPFWSVRTIKRIVENLRKKGLILVTDKFNDAPTNRTLWYTIDYEELERQIEKFEEEADSDKMALSNEITTESDKVTPSKVPSCHAHDIDYRTETTKTTTTAPAQNSDIFPITDDELRQMGHDVPETEQRSDLGQISDLYLSNIGGISPIIGDAMKAYMDDILTTINRQPFHTGESVLSWFQYAINEAVDNDKRNWGYVKAILEGVIKSGSLKAHKASRTNGKAKAKPTAMPELTPAQEEAAEVMRVGLGGVKTPQREAEVRAAIIALFSDGSLTSAEGMRQYLVEYRNSWMGKDSPHPASPRRILDTWGAVMEPTQNGGGEDPAAIKLTDEQKEAARKLNELYG